MKIGFDFKNKKGELEADVEKIVEKGMDNHEKDWKEKFNTKHNAKKEIMELKHKQKIESENNHGKITFFQKIQEEKRKNIELENEEKRRLLEIELEEKRKIEKERKKVRNLKIIFSIIIAIISLPIMITGFTLATLSGDPNSGFYGLGFLGIFIALSIVLIWKNNTKENSDEGVKHKRKKR